MSEKPLRPFFQQLLDSRIETAAPNFYELTPEEGRGAVAATRDVVGPAPPLLHQRDVSVKTRHGEMRVRILEPAPERELAGTFIYIHGGGWVVGSIEDYSTLTSTLATLSGFRLVVPDYPLSPEVRYPVALDALEDMATNLEQMLSSGERVSDIGPLGEKPLVVGGDSSGGNLAIGLAGRVQASGGVHPASLVLVYPVTSMDTDSPSYRLPTPRLPVSREDMRWFFDCYLGQGQTTNAEIEPLKRDDLASLPPTLIQLAERDVLFDDGHHFARALHDAGVEVTETVYPGTLHGYIRLHNLSETAAEAVEEIAAFLRSSTA